MNNSSRLLQTTKKLISFRPIFRQNFWLDIYHWAKNWFASGWVARRTDGRVIGKFCQTLEIIDRRTRLKIGSRKGRETKMEGKPGWWRCWRVPPRLSLECSRGVDNNQVHPGGRHSTEVALALLTQQPRVRILSVPSFFSDDYFLTNCSLCCWN